MFEKVRLEQWSRKVQNIGGGRHFKYRVSFSFLDCYTDIRVINRNGYTFIKFIIACKLTHVLTIGTSTHVLTTGTRQGPAH